MINVRTFVTDDGDMLIVANIGNTIGFFLGDENVKERRIKLEFEPQEFKSLYEYLVDVSVKTWAGFYPKDATSLSSDYAEYYDKELDNNGYLMIGTGGYIYRLIIDRPSPDSTRLYLFNKGKMQSFIFDMEKRVLG